MKEWLRLDSVERDGVKRPQNGWWIHLIYMTRHGVTAIYLLKSSTCSVDVHGRTSRFCLHSSSKDTLVRTKHCSQYKLIKLTTTSFCKSRSRTRHDPARIYRLSVCWHLWNDSCSSEPLDDAPLMRWNTPRRPPDGTNCTDWTRDVKWCHDSTQSCLEGLCDLSITRHSLGLGSIGAASLLTTMKGFIRWNSQLQVHYFNHEFCKIHGRKNDRDWILSSRSLDNWISGKLSQLQFLSYVTDGIESAVDTMLHPTNSNW